MKKAILKILAAVIGTSVLTYIGLVYYLQYTGFSISLHGHIAVGLGIFFSYAVGASLMALLFFSNKHGHDQTVHSSGQQSDNDSDKG